MRAVDRARSSRPPLRQRGQATVELSLILPVLVLMALFVGQVAVVAVDAVLVHHAAREAARAAAVEPTVATARAAAAGAAGLDPERLRVGLSGSTNAGSTLRVTVTYTAATEVPMVGRLIGDVTLSSVVAVRVE